MFGMPPLFGTDQTASNPLTSFDPNGPLLPATAYPRGMQVNLPQQGGGMFGGGNVAGQAIAAALAGFVSRRNPQLAQSMLQPMMMRQQAQLQQRQQQQQQANELQRAEALYDYQLAHPKPDTPDIVQRIAALNAITPGLGDTYAHNYANNGGGSLIQFVDPSTGQRYAVPSGGASQLPPIGAVIDDPRRSGGQTPPASDGFR